MSGVYKAEDDQSRWRSAFDLAIIRLVLLAGAIRSVQLGWNTLITHVFDTEVRGLFSKPVFVLLPWLLGAIASAFLVYWIGVRLMERRKVSELALASAARYLPLGVIGGLILFGAIIGVLWAQGWATYHGYRGAMGIPTAALIFAAGATFEELTYRGAFGLWRKASALLWHSLFPRCFSAYRIWATMAPPWPAPSRLQ